MARKILIVDDSATARKVVADCLAKDVYTIIEAQDGNEGIKKLEENPDIALIFSDINMPWLSGLEMIGKIKENPSWEDIPICLLTTESSQESLEEAKKLGVNAFLVKPLDVAQLNIILESVFE